MPASGYLYLNAAELRSLSALIETDDLRSLQLSRRDSLDNLCETGFLVASVVDTAGDQWRVAIGETGSITDWGSTSADYEYPRCETCGNPIDYCQGHGTY